MFSSGYSNQAVESVRKVPFLRPELGDEEIGEVVDTLRSGWLTTGPKTKVFEEKFAKTVKSPYAIALNSCTAALHLAANALGLGPGQAVLVPTMTFAATAEIVLYHGAIPILVDCDPVTGNINLDDAEIKIMLLKMGKMPFSVPKNIKVVGIIPVHVGGLMIDMEELKNFAAKHELWVIEDAAHSFPAAWRKNKNAPWQRCGEETATVSCFSFYANKTITTGEGGMAVTNDPDLAERIRLLSLHGLSRDAWGRYSEQGTWDYRIITAGYKYNLTDIASAIGIHQLAKAESMRLMREKIANRYFDHLAEVDEISLPPTDDNRIHSWHLFPIRLNLERLTIDRNAFIEELKKHGVGCSVHWRPLHLHPYYEKNFKWRVCSFPSSTQLWQRVISLPIFPAMSKGEVDYVISAIKNICLRHSVKFSKS